MSWLVLVVLGGAFLAMADIAAKLLMLTIFVFAFSWVLDRYGG